MVLVERGEEHSRPADLLAERLRSRGAVAVVSGPVAVVLDQEPAAGRHQQTQAPWEHELLRKAAQAALRFARECGDEIQARGEDGDKTTVTSEEPTHDLAHLTVLSDAEKRVAALAALGDTNREIAGRLFITVSTVEQHLTRVYRKLGVRGRADLPAMLS